MNIINKTTNYLTQNTIFADSNENFKLVVCCLIWKGLWIYQMINEIKS